MEAASLTVCFRQETYGHQLEAAFMKGVQRTDTALSHHIISSIN